MHVLRKALLGATFLIAFGSWTALASDNVTVMLRSGEKLTGRFDGVSNNQLNLDISATDERKIPMDQVAVIDVVDGASGLPETELSQARGSAHVLVTKDSNLVKGQLVRIDGARIEGNQDPAFVVFRTESGEERRVAMRDVGRLYLGNYPGSAPTSTAGTPTQSTPAPGAGNERVLTVAANVQWTDTAITVRQGDRVTITASGEVTLSADPNDKASPNGAASGRRPTARAPLPQTPAGALIGRIGNSGRPFGIGQGPANLTMPGSGRLYLGINDDTVSDNSGQYEVHIRQEGVTSNEAPYSGSRRRPSR